MTKDLEQTIEEEVFTFRLGENLPPGISIVPEDAKITLGSLLTAREKHDLKHILLKAIQSYGRAERVDEIQWFISRIIGIKKGFEEFTTVESSAYKRLKTLEEQS